MTGRSLARGAALGLSLALWLVASREPALASAQQLGFGMERTGTVGIRNGTERQLFWSLICTCGCPRETLGTCTCGWAHERRAELREELAAGRSLEEIKGGYARRFGSHALTVPPNDGANQLLWAAPLGAIAAGAIGLATFLARLRRRAKAEDAARSEAAGGPADPKAKPGAKAGRDAYDERLDDELDRLDE